MTFADMYIVKNKKISTLFVVLAFLLLLIIPALAHNPAPPKHGYEFIENKNQWNKQVLYRASLPGGSLFLEKNCLTYNIFDPSILARLHGKNEEPGTVEKKFKAHAFKVHFQNANTNPVLSGDDQLDGETNFFLGNDPGKWASQAKGFQTVFYKEIYPKTDFKIYTHDEHLKYDFIVKPGGNTNNISFYYEGIDQISIKEGNLIIKTNAGDITEQKPYAYQLINGRQKQVECHFSLEGKNLGFSFPKGYDRNYELIIDPTLIFSTYSGSYSDNFGYTATFDSYGFLYSGSTSFGPDYPTTLGAYDVTFNSLDDFNHPGGYFTDIAITKYDTTGTKRIYSTFIGGYYDDVPHSLVVDGNNELYIFGTTGSYNYPTSADAYDKSFGGGKYLNLSNGIGVTFYSGTDIVVSKLNNDGSKLLASTFIGGSDNDGINAGPDLRYNYADEIRGEIDIDKNNNIYIATCTKSLNFPTTPGSFQPAYGGGSLDGCIVKLDYDLKNILWSSYIGGTEDDAVYSLALDDSLNIYVTGGTNSGDLPMADTTALFKNFMGGRADGFISRVSVNGDKILNSTYYGSPVYDQLYFIEKDRQNNIYVLGQTEAPDSTFIYNAKYSRANSGQIVAKMNSTLDTLVWSTVFGTGNGRINISPTAFLVDYCNSIYLSGWGGSINRFSYLNNKAGYTFGMDVTADAYSTSTDGSDFYLMVLADDASKITYGTFYGDKTSADHVDGGTSRFDKKGKIYQSVCASCGAMQGFPIKPNPGAVSISNNNSCNNAVFKFDFMLSNIIADFVAPPVACAPVTIDFDNTSLVQKTTTYFWDFGDGTTSTVKDPTHTYSVPGLYKIKLKLNDIITCNLTDSIEKEIMILGNTKYSLAPKEICPGGSTQIGVLPQPGSYTYNWIPATGLSDPKVSNPIAHPSATTKYVLTISNGICTDTISQTLTVQNTFVTLPSDSTICYNTTQINLIPLSNGTVFYWSADKDFNSYLNTDLTSKSILVEPKGEENNYYIKTLSNIGCEAMDSIKVKVKTPSILKDSEKFICYGQTITLVTRSNNPLDPITYSWSPSALIIGDFKNDTVIAKPSTSTLFTVEGTDTLGCKVTETVMVKVADPLYVDLPNNIFTCAPAAATSLNVSSNASYFLWSEDSNFSSIFNEGNNNTGVTVNPLASVNKYYVKGNQDPACSGIDSIFIYVGNPHININSEQLLCKGDSITLTSLNTNTSDTIVYSWTPTTFIIGKTDSSSVLVKPSVTTSYKVIAKDSIGCSNSQDILVKVVDYATVDIPSDTTICSTSGLFSIPATSNSNTLYWSVNNQFNPLLNDDLTLKTLVVDPLLPENMYYVKATAGEHCIATDSIKIRVASPSFTTNKDEYICYGGRIILSAINNNPSDTLRYNWTPVAAITGKPDSSSIEVKPVTSTKFTVVASDSNGCETSKEVNVKVSDLHDGIITATADQYVIYTGQSTTLHALPKGYKYSWTPIETLSNPESQSPVATPKDTTTYTVSVSDPENGQCIYDTSITIYVVDRIICGEPDIFIPNAFTPNGDHNNDVIYVRGHHIGKLHFIIYDRWGEKVFETTDIRKGWDGTFKGDNVDPDVFVYYLEVDCVDGQKYFKKGNVTLIR